MKKDIWRKNFEIKNIHYQMASQAINNMILLQNKTTGKKIIKEIVYVQKDFNNLGTYFKIIELRRLVEETIKIIKNNPQKIRKIHLKTLKLNQEYFAYSKIILKKNLKEISDSQLADIYLRLARLQCQSHGLSLPTTWFVDSDGEDFSNLLIEKIKKYIKKSGENIGAADAFSALTTPEEPSMAIKEEVELLKITQMAKNDKATRAIFSSKKLGRIEKHFNSLPEGMRTAIIKHYQKWKWVPYTYMGPVYEINFYLSAISGLIREKMDLEKQLNAYLSYGNNVKERKNRIISKLRISAEDKRLFEVASEIVFLKAYRKNCLFHGCYALEKILKEIGMRLGLTLKQTWMTAYWETAPAIKRGSFTVNVLNERMKFSVMHIKIKSKKIYNGERAKNFLKSLNLEKEKIIKKDKLLGTSACPGKVKGIVKIISLPQEMDKMEKNNIMVAHTTFPSLVSAMKKASAIVTDDGGITCHAAIVARELKTPCVVGTKYATKILKDGDKVEVDANKGIVKRIK